MNLGLFFHLLNRKLHRFDVVAALATTLSNLLEIRAESSGRLRWRLDDGSVTFRFQADSQAATLDWNGVPDFTLSVALRRSGMGLFSIQTVLVSDPGGEQGRLFEAVRSIWAEHRDFTIKLTPAPITAAAAWPTSETPSLHAGSGDFVDPLT